jgi:hypothetical protein
LACGFYLSQRVDNAELVAAARDRVECGSVRWRPPTGTSHPQVRWVVESRDACSALARSLSAVPLLGKKAGDFAIRRSAVAAWTRPPEGVLRWNRLRRLAYELRAHREPTLHADYTRVDISTADLSGFLAGFASAEAHFGASRDGHPRFIIKLRADDTAVLALLAHRFGVGRLVRVPASSTGRAQTAWLVTRIDHLRKLVPVFRSPSAIRACRQGLPALA